MSRHTIDDVLAELDDVIAWSRAECACFAYFAALYRRVTAAVKQGIAEGRFDDPARMERLDVVFAGRYLDALADWRAGRSVTGAWRVAFGACRRWRPVILQHLLVGINAHILLDLGIAAAEVAPGDAIHDLRADFDRINDTLFDLIGWAEDRILTVSPWMWLVDKVGGRTDHVVVRFNLASSRTVAWSHALQLAACAAGTRDALVAEQDALVAVLGRLILKPGALVSTALLLARVRENRDVRAIIDALSRETA